MKGILRKMSIAGSKRRLSFAPGVKNPDEDFPPPPDFFLPGPSDAPAGDPIPVPGRPADPTPGPPGDVPGPGQVVIVKDDDDFLRGVLDEDSWPMQFSPFLIGGALLFGLALVAVLISYSAMASSGTIMPSSPLPTDKPDDLMNLTSATSSGSPGKPAAKRHGNGEEYGGDATEVSDDFETPTDLDDIIATWDDAGGSVVDGRVRKLRAGAQLVTANDSAGHRGEDKRDLAEVDTITRSWRTSDGTAAEDTGRTT